MAVVAQVIYLDLRGNGRSDAGPASKWSLEQWAEDVHSFCEGLSIEDPIVMGHSLGGIVAMIYAARYPDHPSKLILSSTSTQPVVGELYLNAWVVHAPAPPPWLSGLIRTRPRSPATKRCASRFTRALRRRRVSMSEPYAIPPCGWYSSSTNYAAWSFSGDWIELKCPTLIVAGEDDPITPVADMEDIVAAMRPYLVRFERFANAGHGVYRDRPGAFFRVLRDFIAP